MSIDPDDFDFSDCDSPAQYIEKLKAQNRALRTALIKRTAELDEAALTVARLVLEHKQYQDAMVEGIANLK